MKPILVGVVGNAGSGKDTAANFLVKEFGFKQLSFAAPLKQLTQKIFPFTDKELYGASEYRAREVHFVPKTVRENFYLQAAPWLLENIGDLNHYESLQDAVWYLLSLNKSKLSARIVLQFLGTEWGREKVSKEIWVNAAIRQANEVLKTGTSVVISDTRMRNEVDIIKNSGGRVVKVCRSSATGTVGIVGHASECELQGLPDSFFNVVINNNHTLDDLYEALTIFVECQH